LSHLKRKEIKVLDMALKDKETKGIKYVSLAHVLKVKE